MKYTTLALEGLTLERLLSEGAANETVFLTRNGEVCWALVPADEGDQEVWALRNNAEFMAYLADCRERAKTKPRKTLQQILKKYGVENGDPGQDDKTSAAIPTAQTL